MSIEFSVTKEIMNLISLCNLKKKNMINIMEMLIQIIQKLSKEIQLEGKS